MRSLLSAFDWSRSERWTAIMASALWLVAIGLWLLTAAGRGVPVELSRLVVAAATGAGLVWTAGWVAGCWRRGSAAGEGWRRLLLVAVVLSVAVRFVGIDSEVGAGYYRDEGIYLASAERINDGRLLPSSFIYGHFTFYASAFVIWLRELFPRLAVALAAALYGVEEPARVTWLALRAFAATCGALTVVPVFAAARRLGGPFAAALAAGLIVFSPLYNEVAHVLISDVPAGFFAALTVGLAARLLDGERRRDYVLAGVAAGLAAGSKYPAGVVAVAIVAPWLAWRLRSRRMGAGIVWAGVAAITSFLAVMPALVARAGNVFAGGGRDILFGVRQYAAGGWIGVQPDSNLLWYGGEMIGSFGAPALLLAAIGIFLLTAEERRRLAVTAVYPIVFVALMVAMSMVVKRNLQPVLPAIAVVVGVAAAGWLRAAPMRRHRGLAAALLALVVLAVPGALTVAQDLRLSRPSSREVALQWIAQNLPLGVSFVTESYAPDLPRTRHPVRKNRFAARLAPEELYASGNDYLLLAGPAHYRFLDPANWTKPHHEVFAARYEEMFELPLVRRFQGGWSREGPHLALYRIVPPRVDYRDRRRFAGDELWVPRPGMRLAGDPPMVRFSRHGHPVVVREWLAAGRYRLAVEGELRPGEGSLEVVTVDGRALGEWPLAGRETHFELPQDDKVLLYVRQPAGSVLRALEVVPARREERTAAAAG